MARTAGMLNRSPSLKNKRAYLKRMFEVEEANPTKLSRRKRMGKWKARNGKEKEIH
jgi:hypothetical protein